MRSFFKKLLRIIIIFISFFTFYGFAFASASRSEGGGTSYHSGGYHDSPYSRNDDFDWTDLYKTHIEDPVWLTSLRNDAQARNLSHDFQSTADDFLRYWNYVHYFGTRYSIPGADVSSNSWAHSAYLYVHLTSYFQWGADSGGPWWDITYNSPAMQYDTTVSKNLTDSPGDLYGFTSGSASYEDGVYKQVSTTSGGFGIDRTIARVRVTLSSVYSSDLLGEGDVAFYSNDPGFDVVVITGSELGDGKVKSDGHTIDVWLHFTDIDFTFTIYVDDFAIGGVTAPSVPTLEYPSYINNNYYDKEVNYYNYMTNALDNILDEGVVSDFFEDTSDWGLLSLPPGLAVECLDALGSYSSVCEFHFDGLYLPIHGDTWFRVPPMHFEFDADDYDWLLPFRYLIALSLALTIAYWAYGLVCSALNWGSHL